MQTQKWMALSVLAVGLAGVGCAHNANDSERSPSTISPASSSSDAERSAGMTSESTRTVAEAERPATPDDGASAGSAAMEETNAAEDMKTAAAIKSEEERTRTERAGLPIDSALGVDPTLQKPDPVKTSATTHAAIKDADASARLSSVGPSAKVEGVVGLAETKNGAKLTIHIDDGEPGRYVVQILDSGTCSALDEANTRGMEETTGGGMTTGARTAVTSKKILGRIEVGTDRTGHMEIALTRKQLGAKEFGALGDRLVVIREDVKAKAKSVPVPETSVMACGAIAVEDAG